MFTLGNGVVTLVFIPSRLSIEISDVLGIARLQYRDVDSMRRAYRYARSRGYQP